MSSADRIAETILREGAIRGEALTQGANARARAMEIAAQANAQATAANGQVWGQTIANLGQLPGQVYGQIQHQQAQQQEQQMRQLQIARAQSVIKGEEAAKTLLGSLPKAEDGTLDTSDMNRLAGWSQLTLDQQKEFLGTAEALNAHTVAFNQQRTNHAADVANTILTQARQSGQPLTIDGATMALHWAADAGLARTEEVQKMQAALVSGVEPARLFEAIRSQGDKYKAKPITNETDVAMAAAGGDPIAAKAMPLLKPPPQPTEATLAMQASGGDPAKALSSLRTPVANPETERHNLEMEHLAQQRANRPPASAAASGPAPEIKPGTPEFKVAQDLASGKLTSQQFRSLTAYNRDSGKKMAIYAKASELNPEFNQAQFDLGYKMAGNPAIRQRIVAINSLSPVIDKIDELADQVGNGDMPAWNKVLTTAKFAVGNRPVTNFRQLQILLGEEVGNALGVGSGSDLKTKLGLDLVNPNLSAANFKATMEQLRSVLDARKRNLLDQMGVYGAGVAAPPTSSGGGKPKADPLGIF